MPEPASKVEVPSLPSSFQSDYSTHSIAVCLSDSADFYGWTSIAAYLKTIAGDTCHLRTTKCDTTDWWQVGANTKCGVFSFEGSKGIGAVPVVIFPIGSISDTVNGMSDGFGRGRCEGAISCTFKVRVYGDISIVAIQIWTNQNARASFQSRSSILAK